VGRRGRRLIIVASCVVAVVGCGTAAHRPHGEASKTPQQVLQDAAAALRGAHGYELRATLTQGQSRLRVQVQYASSMSMEMAATTGAEAYVVRRTASGYYVRANAAFWVAGVGARGRLLANRWFHTPGNTALAQGVEHFTPTALAQCLTEDHGTLSIEGRTTINGQAVVVVKDAGDLPGSQPGTLAAAINGPPVPLRVTSTGDQRPGGHIDACNPGSADSSRGTLMFSHFNHVPTIEPPQNAIQLPGGVHA
jgi:hypothetical protein